MLLNMNMLLDQPRQAFTMPIDGLQSGEWGDTVSVVLCVLIICGYLFVAGFEAVTEIPVLANRMVTEARAAGVGKHSQESNAVGRRDLWAQWTPFFTFMLFYGAFIALHDSHFTESKINVNRNWYWIVFGVIFVPWCIVNLRLNMEMQPDQEVDIGFKLLVLYDAVVHLDQLRSSLIQVFFGALGLLWWKSFFSFMLLHIFNLSPDLGNVAEAIRVPAKQLGLTFYVITASTFIYTSFGYQTIYQVRRGGRHRRDRSHGQPLRAACGFRPHLFHLGRHFALQHQHWFDRRHLLRAA